MPRGKGFSVVQESLHYEVLQATTMLLFLLSGARTARQQRQAPGGEAAEVPLPGLPELCFSSFLVKVPDENLYGPTGVASQIAYKGWIAEVYQLWEHRFRDEMKTALSPGAALIRPKTDAFGDLRRIRNDLLHTGTASAEWTGKCKVLRWFKREDRIVLGVNHVLDFLNQAGILSLVRDQGSRGCWSSTAPPAQPATTTCTRCHATRTRSCTGSRNP